MLRKTGTRLLQGTIFAAAMMLAPAALAHSHYDVGRYGYGHDYGYDRDDGYSHHYSHRHHHHHFAGRHRHYAMSSRHRSHRMMAMEDRERATAWEHERDYGERHRDRPRFGRADYAAMDERRERMIADEREEAMTARLNLAELRKGQERDAAIARWEEEYGGSLRG